MSENKKINVAIAGLGRSGWNIHSNALDGLGDLYNVVSVFDLDEKRRQEAVDRFSCKAVDSFDALKNDKDAELLVVATPSGLHPQHTIEGMEAGKHVVCEKPLAENTAAMDKVIETSKKLDRIFAPFQNRRYGVDFQKVKEIIDSGKLGRIVQIRIAAHGFSRRWDWQTLKEFGGGELNNTGPHFIDHALELFGPATPQVYCHMDRALSSGDAEDHVKVVLRAEGAPLVEVEISKAGAMGQDNWLVMGTAGGLKGTTKHLDWKYVDWSTMPERPVDTTPTSDRGYNREELTWTQESWDVPEGGGAPSVTHKLFYQDLYETIRNGKALYITPESVRKQIDVIEQCHQMADVK